MALPYAQPAAQAPQPFNAQPEVVPLVLTPEEQAELDLLYETLKPAATEAARDYVLARTPAKYQVDMMAKIEADWPVPPVMDDAMMESRRMDATAYQRPATPV
jgi:hypothetical protein